MPKYTKYQQWRDTTCLNITESFALPNPGKPKKDSGRIKSKLEHTETTPINSMAPERPCGFHDLRISYTPQVFSLVFTIPEDACSSDSTQLIFRSLETFFPTLNWKLQNPYTLLASTSKLSKKQINASLETSAQPPYLTLAAALNIMFRANARNISNSSATTPTQTKVTT